MSILKKLLKLVLYVLWGVVFVVASVAIGISDFLDNLLDRL